MIAAHTHTSVQAEQLEITIVRVCDKAANVSNLQTDHHIQTQALIPEAGAEISTTADQYRDLTLLTGYAVAVAVKVRAIAGLPSTDWCGTGSAYCGAVGVVDTIVDGSG